MLKLFSWIGNVLRWLALPLIRNTAFFIFMYAVGYLCTQLEVSLQYAGAQPYELSEIELFVDLYLLCAVLTVIPDRLRKWVKGLLYVFLYGTALIDMFCFDNFDSKLTPTMLMLVGETTGREAGEFARSFFSTRLVTSITGWILLIITLHILWVLLWHGLRPRLRMLRLQPLMQKMLLSLFGLLLIPLLCLGYDQCQRNKRAMARLFACDSIGQVERELANQDDKAELYLPVYRLVFSIFANRLASHQVDDLLRAEDHIQIDSCSFRVPNIVLVIGESYSRHHSQLYGYDMPTTPRQLRRAKDSTLVVFTDVVSPWNLTSYVFKNVLSLHALGDDGDWSDSPLFPAVFRKAGYHVSFITNQFLPRAGEAIYDFSGGFFLNNPELSATLFDTRNDRLHQYDEGILDDHDSLLATNSKPSLTILHLMGSHMAYKERYPQQTHKHLLYNMYDRPDLSHYQKLVQADYDNSVLYNDSVIDAVMCRYENKDALVIYMADHGEEMFDDSLHIWGRIHPPTVDYRLARAEFEIPFWIWGSEKYREHHPYGWRAICNAANRPLMTDVLPHLLLYLGGISTPDYRDDYNIISPTYNRKRKRLLRGTTDYNSLKTNND